MSQKEGKKFPYKRLIFAGAAALLAALLALAAFLAPFHRLLPAYAIPPREEGEQRLHFLSVGQGDCTVVEFSDGEVLVVDGGDGSFACRNKLVRYLKGLHPAHLSLLLTHADSDHYGGLSVVLDTFDVETCYLPLLPAGDGRYAEFLAAVEKEGCGTAVFTRYDRLGNKDGYCVCLSPRLTGEEDENDSSTVLYLNFGGVTALLCGDISETREKLLVSEYALAEGIFDSGEFSVRLDGIDILKAPHHGSAYSSSEEFLQLLRPRNYILSCGADNAYKHPSGEALARFRAVSPEGKIYRTDELGDVIVSVKQGNYTLSAR